MTASNSRRSADTGLADATALARVPARPIAPLAVLMCLLQIGTVATAAQLTSAYSSFIKPSAGKRVLWQVGAGTCHSLLALSPHAGEPQWQHLPEGAAEALAFDDAVAWNSTLVYNLRRQPGLIATNTHSGDRRYTFPTQSALHPDSVLGLPRGSLLRGPLAGPAATHNLLILHSHGTAPAASSHIYAINPSDGSLSWQADVAPFMAQAAADAGLDPSGAAVITDWVTASSSRVVLTVSVRQPGASSDPACNSNAASQQQQQQQQRRSLQALRRSAGPWQSRVSEKGFAGNPDAAPSSCYVWGMAIELHLVNGSLAWASNGLDQGLERVAGSTDSVAVALSTPDPDGSRHIYAVSRGSGAMLWSAPCLAGCRVQVLDSQSLLVAEDPITLEGLRMLDLTSGEVVWRAPASKIPTTECGAPSMTSTDLVVACQCQVDQRWPVEGSSGKGRSVLRDVGAAGMAEQGSQQQVPKQELPKQEQQQQQQQRQQQAVSQHRSIAPRREHGVLHQQQRGRNGVCYYALRLRDGRTQQEVVLDYGSNRRNCEGGGTDTGAPLHNEGEDSGQEEHTGDCLPPDATHLGAPGPLVLADKVVVALRHSIAAVGRVGASTESNSSDAGEGGGARDDVLWRWKLPEGLVVESWMTLELHSGLLLVRLNEQQQLGGKSSGSSKGGPNSGAGRMSTGESSRGGASGSSIESKERIASMGQGASAMDQDSNSGLLPQPAPAAGLYALDPVTGKVLWSVPLGPTLPPTLFGPVPLAFLPGVALLDRCSAETPQPNTTLPGSAPAAANLRNRLWQFLNGAEASPRVPRLSADMTPAQGTDSGDLRCCLDAVDLASGQLLWSHCLDQSAVCRRGQAKSLAAWLVEVLLALQALVLLVATVGMLVYAMTTMCPAPSILSRRKRSRMSKPGLLYESLGRDDSDTLMHLHGAAQLQVTAHAIQLAEDDVDEEEQVEGAVK